VNYLAGYGSRETRQSERIPGRTDQIENSAGGYVFPVDDWTRLDRFLVLGSEGGSYYATERKLTAENAEAVFRCVYADGLRTVYRITEMSVGGRAPKNDPSLFALAIAASAGSEQVRRAALDRLPAIARTGTHLFQFLSYVQEFRGWGPALRRAIAEWYEEKDPGALGYQLVKYRSRFGWTHRDVIRKAHPSHSTLIAWAAGKPTGDYLPAIVRGYEAAQAARSPAETASVLREFPVLPWEAVNNEHTGSDRVWGQLLENGIPLTALIRNLGRLTSLGLIHPFTDVTTEIVARLQDEEEVTLSRLHPVQLLSALTTYGSGSGARGSLTWEPVQAITDALEDAFYLAFRNVKPTGKRLVLSLDVSGSMNWETIAGVPGLTPRVASAALALVTAATEERFVVNAFSDAMVPVQITGRSRIADALNAVDRIPMGGTDCALPMLDALKKGIEADAFVVYTDSETWFGQVHPVQALREYREATGIPARLVVVGMVSNGFSIADPEDAGMMDVVGFDTSAPALIADFIAGR
jgi:60 kDa SS-A/Ro ribonucleoprotein